MSKGTKQFRLGRVLRLIEQMETSLKTLEDAQVYEHSPLHNIQGRIIQLKQDINTLKSEFNIED